MLILADWIAIGAVAGLALLGMLLGFGKGLKFFTSGIFGIIISVFICYCLGGFILTIPFVGDLLAKFAALWRGKENFFFNILTKIRLEIIVYYIVLFIVVQLARIIIVRLIKRVFEIKFILIKIINKVFGAVLFVGMGILIALLVLQIIHWVGGETAVSLLQKLDGSVFKLDKLFLNNPLNSIRF